MQIYEESLKTFRDIYASLESKFFDGKAEGIKEEKIEIAKKMLEQNLNIDIIKNDFWL